LLKLSTVQLVPVLLQAGRQCWHWLCRRPDKRT